MQDEASRKRIRWPAKREKGDVVHHIVGETRIILVQSYLSELELSAVENREAFLDHIKQRKYAELWEEIRRYMSEANNVEVSLIVGPVIASAPVDYNPPSVRVFVEAYIAPLYSGVQMDRPGWDWERGQRDAG